ncbi:MAG TPA: CHAT domain-containing tetratricopeptide repeat protein [Candidatus Sulfopaludibacter sp.]|nr:CHAT domain-containing tetratricopeptide repeat protein [Candidatus Sulfopaludibacter sp.]
MRTFLRLAIVVWLLPSATAQQSLAERLLSAPDRESVLRLLDSAAEPVDQAVFQSVRQSAQASLDKREFPAAGREFAAALAVAERLKSAAAIAVAYLGIGTAQLRSGQFTPSLSSFEKGYAAAVEAGDKALQANLLRSSGASYSSLGRLSDGLDYAARALPLYRELGDRKGASFVLNNTCAAQMVLGDLRQAAANCEEAFRLSRGFPDAVAVGIGNLGPILAQQGNLDAARDYLEETIRLLEQQHDPVHLAGAYLNIGPVYTQLHDTPKALAAYGKAIEIARDAHDTAGQAMALFNRASIYSGIDREKQVADLRAGLRLQEQNESSYETVYGLSALANYENTTGHVEEGCGHAARAVEIAQRFGSPQLLWAAFGSRGYCEVKRDAYPKARLDYEEAVRQIELVRASSSGGDQERQAFFSDKMEPYHNLISVLVALKDPAGALSVAERGKARQLLDTSLRGKTQAAQSMTLVERADEQRLSGEEARLGRRVAMVPAASRAEAQAGWERARREFEDFRGHLYSAHPQLAFTRGDAVPFQVADAAGLLPDTHTLLVEFVVTSRDVWTFTLQRSGGKPVLHVHVMAWPKASLLAEVGAFRAQLGARDLGYRQAAQALYKRLLGPLEADLNGKDTLVLVPDGGLWNLPFQALLRPDGAHLMERQNVFYAPSLTYLRETRNHSGPAATRAVLALGNPASAQLPNAAREVRALADLYGASGTTVLTGGLATRQAWMAAAPDYRVLHIATHGILNPGNPMYSWLEVAPGKEAGDGALEARDILAMNLHADVAVLSACDTARGGVLAGEGLVGMSWAFLAAGAHATVVSQWSVDSAGTTDLMLAFHRNLKAASGAKPFGRAQALQKAMLALKAMPQYSHPFYWASFVLIGNGY